LKIHRVEVSKFSDAADTLKRSISQEKALIAEFDNNARLIYLKGCLHEGADPCIKEYNLKIHYAPAGIISSSVSIHFDRGKKFYDSLSYVYFNNGKLQETDRYLVPLNSSEEDTLRGITMYKYSEKGFL